MLVLRQHGADAPIAVTESAACLQQQAQVRRGSPTRMSRIFRKRRESRGGPAGQRENSHAIDRGKSTPTRGEKPPPERLNPRDAHVASIARQSTLHHQDCIFTCNARQEERISSQPRTLPSSERDWLVFSHGTFSNRAARCSSIL